LERPVTYDPFFHQIRDGEWNACIGVQADAQDYVDGFIEAARVLIAAVIDTPLTGSRDTLALPILYNARHGLELALKFAIDNLNRMGVLAPHPANHDLLSHWKHLSDAHVGDEAIRALVNRLEPFVRSLARIDDDGQELRYPANRDGEKSLGKHSVVNLKLIRASIEEMSLILGELCDRIIDFESERTAGAYSPECSTKDLKAIAAILGDHAHWNEASFDEKRAGIRDQFGLTSNGFSRAVNAIKESRPLGTLVGLETKLDHITDEKVLWTAERWLEAQPPHDEEGPWIVEAGDISLEQIEAHTRTGAALVDDTIANLSVEEFADLESVFEIGRLGRSGDFYGRILKQVLAKHRLEKERWVGVHHILSKTNFLEGLARGLDRVGRPSLGALVGALGGGGES
jgi:hypothetical protein